MREETAAPGKRSFTEKIVTADLVVAGAGPAGFAAAVSAARMGLRVALVQDRPVIGGNHSSEIRVGISGAGHRPWGRYSEETGALHEFQERMARRAEDSGVWNWGIADWVYLDMIEEEPNIALYLNTLIEDVELSEPGRIAEAVAVQQRSETRYRFRAPFFLDCTGDGTLGHLAGADWRQGRESRRETGEPRGPESADGITMGATLYFYSLRRDRPVRFTPPPGSFDLKGLKPEDFPYNGRCFPRRADGTFGPYWWAEIAGTIDGIGEDPEVLRQSRRLINGIWDYIKNSGRFENVENLDLDFIAPLPGKRETRRLLGPVIMTETMQREQAAFDDAAAFCGYMLDVHPEHGFRNPDWDKSCHVFHDGPSDIPLRCLFSRNVGNLFFAGRNVSSTHYALGTLRVAGTCASMGIGAAAAAAVCLRGQTLPARMTPAQISGMQTLALRHDGSLLGRTLREDHDLSRGAQVRASSVRTCAIDEAAGRWAALDRPRGVCLPVAGETMTTLDLYLQASEPTEAVLDLYACDRPQNYRLQTQIGTVRAAASGEGWVNFRFAAAPGKGQKLFFLLRPNPALAVRLTRRSLCGALGLEVAPEETVGFATAFHRPQPGVYGGELPCLRAPENDALFAAENVQDGHIRPFALPHLWSSAPLRAGGEWIEHTFAPATVDRIELVFNSDLNHDKMGNTNVAREVARAYTLTLRFADGSTREVARETDNFRRLRAHAFAAAANVTGVRLTIHETWGHPHAEVFDVRIYRAAGK